jgi:hypothetical protein
VGYGCQINLDPISEKEWGFYFIEIDEYWMRFEKKGRRG